MEFDRVFFKIKNKLNLIGPKGYGAQNTKIESKIHGRVTRGVAVLNST